MEEKKERKILFETFVNREEERKNKRKEKNEELMRDERKKEQCCEPFNDISEKKKKLTLLHFASFAVWSA